MSHVYQYAAITTTDPTFTAPRCGAPLLDATNCLLRAFQRPFRLAPVASPIEPKPNIALSDVLKIVSADPKPHYVVLGSPSLETAVKLSAAELQCVDLFTVAGGFHYFSLLRIVADILSFEIPTQSVDSVTRGRMKDSLKCQEWLRRLQTSFTHGDRNEMLLPEYQDRWPDDIARIKTLLDEECGHANCPIKTRLRPLISNETAQFDEQHLPVMRHIANECCEISSLFHADCVSGSQGRPYNRVFIIENNLRVVARLHDLLQKHIRPKSPQSSEEVIHVVNYVRSLAEGKLITVSGKQIEWESLGIDDLITIDLELGVRPTPYGVRPDGIRLVYQCALHAPMATRIVVSAESHLESLARLSGAGVFLEKPFTGAELANAIKAAVRDKVLWICTPAVQWEWFTALRRQCSDANLTFRHILTAARRTLDKERITLEFSETVETASVLGATIVIFDVLPSSPDGADLNAAIEGLVAQIADTIRISPAVNVIALVPRHDAFRQPDGLMQKLYRVVRPDHDRIVDKPLAVGSARLDSIEAAVLETIKTRPRFNVRYRVLTPLIGLVWPRVRHLLGRRPEDWTLDERITRWSPLAILVGELRGFSYSTQAIWQDAGLPSQISSRLSRLLGDSGKWGEFIGDSDIQTRVEDFLNFTHTSNHLHALFPTVEAWVRHALNTRLKPAIRGGPSENVKTLRELTGSLTRMFGGETRHEFVSRGGWYDSSGRLVEDVPLVIEFCAKKGVLAREAIRDTIANYLTEMGGEDVVLMTEEAIKGFMFT